jgi:hypothetical protein
MFDRAACLAIPVRHKYRRPPSHQAAVKQLDPSKHPTPVFEWQQLPEETRQMVTRQMVTSLTWPIGGGVSDFGSSK